MWYFEGVCELNAMFEMTNCKTDTFQVTRKQISVLFSHKQLYRYLIVLRDYGKVVISGNAIDQILQHSGADESISE